MNKNGAILIFSILFVLLCTLSVVAASDMNSTDTIAKDDTVETITETTDSNLESDEILTANIEEQENILNATNDDKLGEAGSFSDLQKIVKNAKEGDTIYLDKEYKASKTLFGDEITINKRITIDGQGNTLNCAKVSAALKILANDVVIKNIRIVDFNESNYILRDLAAIYIGGDNVKIENCIFEYNFNTVLTIVGNGATVDNCIFNTNYGCGNELVKIKSQNNRISNCIFKYNGKTLSYEKYDIDSIIYMSDVLNVIQKCYFTDNTARKGIIYMLAGTASKYNRIEGCFFGAAKTNKDYFGLICNVGNNNEVSDSIFCTPIIQGNILNSLGDRILLANDNIWLDGKNSNQMPTGLVGNVETSSYKAVIVSDYYKDSSGKIIYKIPTEITLTDSIELKLLFVSPDGLKYFEIPKDGSLRFQVRYSDKSLKDDYIDFKNESSTSFTYTALNGKKGTIYIYYNKKIITSIKITHRGEYDSIVQLKTKMLQASEELNLNQGYKFYSSTDDINGITINKNMIINGNNYTIDGSNAANTIFNLADGKNITIKNLNFINFKDFAIKSESGNNGQITLINCNFKDCGGGISSNRITIISGCTFENTTSNAVNLYSNHNTTNTIDESTFVNCKSNRDGGAGYINSPTKITNSTFEKSDAKNGGALYVVANNCVIDECEFIGNTADYIAAGIYFEGNNCSLTNTAFINNSATSNVQFYFKTTPGTVENNTDMNNRAHDNSLIALNEVIKGVGNVLNLESDYEYKSAFDKNVLNGIIIESRNLTIEGRGHTIDGGNYASLFQIEGKSNITFNNINFVNSFGVAINICNANKVVFNNCTFESTFGDYSGSDGVIVIGNTSENYVSDSVVINRCTFIDNDIDKVIFAKNGSYTLTIKDSNFANPNAIYDLYLQEHETNNNLDYNWWGNTADNIFESPKVNADLNNWYFLDTALDYGYAMISLNNLYDDVFNTITKNSSCNLFDLTAELIATDLVTDSNVIIQDGSLTLPYKTVKKPAYLTTNIHGICHTANTTQKGQFDALQDLIDAVTENTVNLTQDYIFTENLDSVSGIVIEKDDFIINGNGHTINALGMSKLINILSDNVTLMNVNLINGYDPISQSSPIQWSGDYGVMKNCIISNNSAKNGGAVYWTGIMGWIGNSTFKDNKANNHGGAVFIDEIGGSISDSEFINNTAIYGGSIYVNKGHISIDESTFTNNYANDGGAVYWNGENGMMENCIFQINSALDEGGAIFWNGAEGIIITSDFTLNKAKNGGAVYWNKEYGEIDGCEFESNTATNGGSIYWNDNHGTVIFSYFVGNSATNGGSIYWNYDYGQVIESTFFDNAATEDGGAIYFSPGNFIKNEHQTVNYSQFAQNSAKNGGAIYAAAQKSSIGNSTFEENEANKGGALYATFRDGTISQSVFINNTANEEGSAIYTDEYSTTINYCVFFENNEKSMIYYDQPFIVFSKLNADYNWFGNNITNFNQKFANVNSKVELNKWYFLDMEMENGIANITLNSLFDNTNNYVLVDENCKSPQIGITLINENLIVEDIVSLGENGYVEVDYLPNSTEGSLKASFETASVTRSNDFLLSDVMITSTEDEFPYGSVMIENNITNPTITEVEITNESGKLIFQEFAVGYCAAAPPDLEVGTYTITIINFGNGTTVSSNATKTFRVTKATPTINVVTKDVICPNDVIVNVTCDSTGNFTLKIGNQTKEFNLTESVKTASFKFERLTAGEYTINVTYSGNENYASAFNDTVKVNVTKINTAINSTVDINDYDVTITVNVNPNATGFVFLTYDKFAAYLALKDGNAAINNTLSAGDYNVTIKYLGDDIYLEASETKCISIVKPTKTESKIEITEVNGNNITGVLKDIDNNVIADAELKYTVNGTTKSVLTEKDGSFVIEAQLNIPISIVYAGDNDTEATNSTITIGGPAVPAFVKIESAFNISSDATTVKGYAIDKQAGEKGMTYATALLDADGNPISNVLIQFGVNSKIYNRTTYENGSFDPYHLDMKRAGVYTLAFSFGGNDNYTSAFAVVALNLDKKPIKIKASAKTYKASVKTKKYTVSLSTIVGSSADGKAHLSPKKVTLTVNGKTFNAKTNKNGKVTFKITNLSKKGKYAAEISVKEDRTYNGATKKVKITVN